MDGVSQNVINGLTEAELESMQDRLHIVVDSPGGNSFDPRTVRVVNFFYRRLSWLQLFQNQPDLLLGYTNLTIS